MDTLPLLFAYSLLLTATTMPTRKKFKDEIYKPVWENLGSWNCYDGRTDHLYKVNTVSLSRSGDIRCKKVHFMSFNQNKKKQLKKLLVLKRGHYNLAALYQN